MKDTHIKKTPEGWKFCDRLGNLPDIDLNKKGQEIKDKVEKVKQETPATSLDTGQVIRSLVGIFLKENKFKRRIT